MTNVFKVSKQNMMLVLYVVYYNQIMFSSCAHDSTKEDTQLQTLQAAAVLFLRFFYKQHSVGTCLGI